MKNFKPLLLNLLYLISASCAPSPRELGTRIVGGNQAAKGRYPYFAGVQFFENGTGFYVSCGGTLIHKDIVLTAAHCLDLSNFDLSLSLVQVGLEDDTVTTGYYEAYMEKVIPHPTFNNEKDDILIIKLKTPISEVTPVTLNTISTVPVVGAAEVVFGFGSTSSGGDASSVLLEVGLNAVSFTTCNNFYGTIFDEGMTCSFSAGKDSCQGDSGGPLILGGSSSAATDIQVGIVSGGVGCGDTNVPGIYTRVSYYIPWIQNQICLWSSFKPAICTSSTAPTSVPTSVPTQAPVPTTMIPSKAPVPVTKTPTKAPVSATKGPTKAPTISSSTCKYYSRNAISALPNTCSCSTESCSCTNTADILKSNKGAVCKDCQWCLGGVCAVPFGTYGENSPYSPFGYGTGFTYTSGRTGKFIMTEELNASESFTYTCKAFYNDVQCTSCKYYSCGGNYWPYVDCGNIQQGATANFCYLNNGVPNNPNHLLFGLAVEYYSPCV